MLLTSTLVLSAAGYGAAAGALLPRAVYRFAVPRERPLPRDCPGGHSLPGSWRGWVGPARCPDCVPDGPATEDTQGATAEKRDAAAAGAPPAPNRTPESAPESAPESTAVTAPDPAPAPDSAPSPDPAPAPDPASEPDSEPDSAERRPRPGTPDPAYGPRSGSLVLVGALVCAALVLIAGPRPELAVWLLAAPFGLLLAAVDVRVRRLPDVLTLPLAALTVVLLGLASISPGAQGSWVRALLGGAVLAGGFFVLFLVHPRGLGFGDVKLALTPGVALGWYGWEALLAGAFLAFLLHASFGVALIVAGRAGRKTALPFGPFLLMGALLGMFAAGPGA
ncbi:prepilin peptidase [Streptomyces ovatisporus]|uniref:Prepilin peptidase n=1 Tax=Streptomyces ovatisporus TaxID=1128682 RepID=A0ABV9A0W7_9ACTN